MIVYVSLIDMGGDDYGKVFAPQFVGELNADGVGDVGCYLTGLEGLVSVVGLDVSSPVPGSLQARTLEWVAISFSNA